MLVLLRPGSQDATVHHPFLDIPGSIHYVNTQEGGLLQNTLAKVGSSFMHSFASVTASVALFSNSNVADLLE